jgi:hypothetical protein
MKGRISRAKVRQLIKEFSQNADKFIHVMKQLPPETLLLFRNQYTLKPTQQ